MQSEAPLTLILSPLRAGRGELERTCLGSLFGDPDTVPPKVPLSLRKREKGRMRVHLDCMNTGSGMADFTRLLDRLKAGLRTKAWKPSSSGTALLSLPHSQPSRCWPGATWSMKP